MQPWRLELSRTSSGICVPLLLREKREGRESREDSQGSSPLSIEWTCVQPDRHGGGRRSAES
eukprot:6509021-Pyramimonas_sp.AAC.1